MSHDHTQVFLSFTLGGMEYGLDMRQVREQCLLESLDRFVDDNQVVPGVARARGVIMPLVDMRAAFAGHPLQLGPKCNVIILTLSHCVMGMVVESINGEVALRADQIRPLACDDGAFAADYLIGLGESGDRRLILVDIDRLMAVGQDRAACLV